MSLVKTLRGTGVALVTPFDENQQIDYVALKRLLEHTQLYVDFWVLQGTTGESVTCEEKEKQALLEFVKKNNPKNIPIVLGLGGNNTKALTTEMRQIDTEGISAFLSVSPYYNKPTQEGIYRHYIELAEASPCPILLYNVPSRTSANMKAETTLRLAQHHNIIGIKEAAGDMMQCMQIARYKPQNFILLSGDDAMTVPMISAGAEGVIAVLANAFPKEFTEMVNVALAGNMPQAKEATLAFYELYRLMFVEGNPTGIKQALSLLGICRPDVRLPLVEASSTLRNELQKEIENFFEYQKSVVAY